MCIEEVFVSAAAFGVVDADTLDGAKLHFDELECVVAVKESCPEIDFPAEAPARAVVASAFKSFAAGCGKLGGAVNGDDVCGMESIKMRNVSVVDFNLGIVAVIFEKLTLAAELEWRKLAEFP